MVARNQVYPAICPPRSFLATLPVEGEVQSKWHGAQALWKSPGGGYDKKRYLWPERLLLICPVNDMNICIHSRHFYPGETQSWPRANKDMLSTQTTARSPLRRGLAAHRRVAEGGSRVRRCSRRSTRSTSISNRCPSRATSSMRRSLPAWAAVGNDPWHGARGFPGDSAFTSPLGGGRTR